MRGTGWRRLVATGALMIPVSLGCEAAPAPRIPVLERVPPLPPGVLEGAEAARLAGAEGARFRVHARGVRTTAVGAAMVRGVVVGGSAAAGAAGSRSMVPGEEGPRVSFGWERVDGVVRLGHGGTVEWEGWEMEGVADVGGQKVGVTAAVDRELGWRVRVGVEALPVAKLREWLAGGWLAGTWVESAAEGAEGNGGAPSWLSGLTTVVPEDARVSGVGAVWGREGVSGFEAEWLEVEGGGSRLLARGRVVDLRLEEVLIEAAPLRLGGEGGSRWVGWLSVEGGTGDELAVVGEVAGEVARGARGPEGAASAAIEMRESSRISFAGAARLAPEPWLDLEVHGAPLRVADTAFDVALRISGGPDSLALTGKVGLRGLGGVVGEVSGRVGLPGGELGVRVGVDSVPLAALSWPVGLVEGVGGQGSGELLVGGTVGAPKVRGRAEVGPSSFRVAPLGLEVDSLRGVIRLEDGLVWTDSLGARAGGGTLRAEGAVRLGEGANRFEAALMARDVRVARGGGVDLTLSADLGLAGSFAEPRLSGRVHGLSGWVGAELFHSGGAVDLKDPPYAELARLVPWPARSRLLRTGRARGAPAVRGEVVLEVSPRVRVLSVDSELYGSGRVRVIADSSGWSTRGVLGLEGGHYAFFGKRFEITGGAVHFDGDGFAPHILLLAEGEDGGELSAGLQETTTAPARFPPFEYFLLGRAASARGTVQRLSLFQEHLAQLAEDLMYGLEPEPVTGWRSGRRWLPDRPGSPLNRRAAAQAAPLLWSYLANEGYRLVPLNRVWLRAGSLAAADAWGGEVVVGSVIGLGAAAGSGVEFLVSQPLVGRVVPGLRVRRRLGEGGALDLFSESRFDGVAAEAPGAVGFRVRRKTGVGVRWRWEF